MTYNHDNMFNFLTRPYFLTTDAESMNNATGRPPLYIDHPAKSTDCCRSQIKISFILFLAKSHGWSTLRGFSVTVALVLKSTIVDKWSNGL